MSKTKKWIKGPYFTEPGQEVTKKNIYTLPEGSVVNLPYDEKFKLDGGRLIHLHDGVWLWCDGGSHCYGGLDCHLHRVTKGSYLCHLGRET